MVTEIVNAEGKVIAKELNNDEMKANVNEYIAKAIAHKKAYIATFNRPDQLLKVLTETKSEYSLMLKDYQFLNCGKEITKAFYDANVARYAIEGRTLKNVEFDVEKLDRKTGEVTLVTMVKRENIPKIQAKNDINLWNMLVEFDLPDGMVTIGRNILKGIDATSKKIEEFEKILQSGKSLTVSQMNEYGSAVIKLNNCKNQEIEFIGKNNLAEKIHDYATHVEKYFDSQNAATVAELTQQINELTSLINNMKESQAREEKRKSNLAINDISKKGMFKGSKKYL